MVDKKTSQKEKLDEVIKKVLDYIGIIRKKTENIEENVNKEEEKMFATKKLDEKLHSFFQIQDLKLSSFSDVEAEVKEISPLLNEAYALSEELGGIIKEDYFNLCQDLSKGFDLDLLEKNANKLRKHLTK